MSDAIDEPGSVAKIFILLDTLLASLMFLLSSTCGGGWLVAGVLDHSDVGTSVRFFFVSVVLAVPTFFAARAGWRKVNAWGEPEPVVPPPAATEAAPAKEDPHE